MTRLRSRLPALAAGARPPQLPLLLCRAGGVHPRLVDPAGVPVVAGLSAHRLVGAAGVTAFCALIPQFVVGPLAGAWIDRQDKKKPG